MCDKVQYLSSSVWLISLSIIPSRSTHVAKNGTISFFLKAEWYFIVYIHHISYIKKKIPLQHNRVVKNAPANAGDITDAGLIPGLGRSPGEGNGNPLQYSCLENPIDRGAWTVHRVTRVGLKRLSMHTISWNSNLKFIECLLHARHCYKHCAHV